MQADLKLPFRSEAGARRRMSLRELLGQYAELIVGRNLASPLLDTDGWKRATKEFEALHPDFALYYEQVLRPQVQKVEAKRIAIRKAFRWRLIGALIFIMCSLYLLYASIAYITGAYLNLSIFLVLASVPGTLCILYNSAEPVRNYKSDIKSEIFPLIFAYFGEDYIYMEEPPFRINALRPSNLIPPRYGDVNEDYIYGTFKGVGLEIVESDLWNEWQSFLPHRVNTIFVRLSVNKAFNSHTLLKQSGRLSNRFSGRYDALIRVQLEDPVFERRLDVYSTDQIEARYLLTPAFMERFLALPQTFRASGTIEGSFYDNHLLLKLPTRVDRFEPGSIFEPATFFDEIDSILREMAEIFGIIDALRLDQRIRL